MHAPMQAACMPLHGDVQGSLTGSKILIKIFFPSLQAELALMMRTAHVAQTVSTVSVLRMLVLLQHSVCQVSSTYNYGDLI